jgi:hypothetical protein
VAVWIAARAAARVLPVWWEAVLTEEWARTRDLTAMPILRALVISMMAGAEQHFNKISGVTAAKEGVYGLVADVVNKSADVGTDQGLRIDGSLATFQTAM